MVYHKILTIVCVIYNRDLVIYPFYICQFASANLQVPIHPHPRPATTSLFSMSVSLFLFRRQVHLCHILDCTSKCSILLTDLYGKWEQECGDEIGERRAEAGPGSEGLGYEKASQEAHKAEEGSCRAQLGSRQATLDYIQKNLVWISHIWDSSKLAIVSEMYIHFSIILTNGSKQRYR